jgi:WD40 repeat protein
LNFPVNGYKKRQMLKVDKMACSVNKSCRFKSAVAAILIAATLASAGHTEDLVGYDQVKDILRKRCVTCHNPDELRGDLDLKDLVGIKAGSASGAVVVANDPNTSLLYTTIAHLEDPVMPPNSSRLPAREQDLIRRWIEGGLSEKSRLSSTSQTMQIAAIAEKSSNKPSASSKTIEPAAGMAKIRSLPQVAAIRAVDAHPSRDLIAVSGLRQAVLIEPSTGMILGALDTPQGSVTALRFSRDGRLLLVGVSQPAIQGSVVAFDVESGRIQWQVGDETDSILALDLSIDGKTLAVGGPTRTVRLYDVATGAVIHSLKKHTDWILTLQFSPDGLLLASGDRFGTIVVWEPKNGVVFHNLKDHVGAVHSLVWDSSCETLVSGGHDGILRMWNLHHGELTSRWEAQVGAILSVAKGPDAIVATGRKKMLSIWSSPEHNAAMVDLADQGEALAMCADNRSLAATDASGQISIVDLKDQRIAHQLFLPTDANSIPQLLQRVDNQHAEYLAEVESNQRLQQSAISRPEKQIMPIAAVSVDAAATGSPKPLTSKAAVNSAVKVEEALKAQIESGKQQLQQATTTLQASNQTLVSLAKLNEDLVSLVGQSSQIQAQLAQQIAEQAKLLQEMQVRQRQMEEMVDSTKD